MSLDEEYVRANWECVHRCDGSYRGYLRGTVLLQDTHGHWLDFAAWAAAAEFTREREEQIRQLKRQIEWCDAGLSKWHDPIYWHWDENEREEESVVRTRASNAREDVTGRLIVARLESALADLRKGMS